MDNGQMIALWRARLEAGLSLQDVAEALNVKLVTVIHWEQCRTLPKFENRLKLCSLFDVPYCSIKWGKYL